MDPIRVVVQSIFLLSGMFATLYLGGVLALTVSGQEVAISGWHLMFVLINWLVCCITGSILSDLLKGE